MQQDWLNYMRRFRATLKASESETGLSLTKRDLERRLSVPEKLEQMCPEFQSMKALVGRRANITPSSTFINYSSTGSINFNVIALMIRTVSPVEKVGYLFAEPLVDKDNSFFFLKLVSRLPEHPVTETIIRELI
ncbi:hypothetical protein JG688_00016273 [Phytophthora aleatoria]|uniref:Uncharacterized protein n=1 Tax=Phytophthora aleatoria TaxID=2496075 RepID=A0A8J5ICN8_9STRA|nr:hypothetical protein JG688_00016273 [Phytophthora aleatoria]